MARNKSINVKIATTKVIKALEAALVKLEKDYSAQEANKAKHDKAVKAWEKEVAKLAMKYISKATEVSVTERWNKEIYVSFTLSPGTILPPQEPKKNYTEIAHYTYNDQKEEIGNAIRILKMTDEEYVNTSTYNSVSKYL